MVLGSGVNKGATVAYCFVMIYLINYLIIGLVMAIVLDGFGKYMEEHENSKSENEN